MKSKYFVIALVIFLPIIVLVLVAVMFMQAGNMQNPNNSVQTSTSIPNNSQNSTTSLSNLINFQIAAVQTQGSVALTNLDSNQVVIQLDNRNWQSPKWQPKRDVLAVLADTNPGPQSSSAASQSRNTRPSSQSATSSNNTNQPVYNLFMFSPAQNQWTQLTSYNQQTSGIKQFEWLNDTTIAFTQGIGVESWLHHLDYQNNQIVKVFKTEANLLGVKQEKYLFEKNNFSEIILTNSTGEVLRSYNPKQLGDNVEVVKIGLNTNAQLWMLLSFTSQQIMYLFTDDSTQIPTEILRVRLGAQKLIDVCELQNNFYFIQVIGNNLQIINLANINLPAATLVVNQDINKLSTNIFCSKDHIFIRVFGGESNQWYKFSGSELQVLPNFANIEQIAVI